MLSISEHLTQQFYTWEKRGRGWKVFPYTVDLEPEFRPLFLYEPPTETIDDGRKPTLLSSLTSYFTKAKKVQGSTVPSNESNEAFPYEDGLELVGWKIGVPKGRRVLADEMHQLLLMLSSSSHPISFEILGTESSIQVQILCRKPDSTFVYGQLNSFFPDCIFTELSEEEGQHEIFDEELCLSAADFGIAEEFMRPLHAPRSFEPDPLIGLYGILEHLQQGERGFLQILFKGTVNSWAESIIRSVTSVDGSSFFLDAPEMVKLAQEKVKSPLFATVIKLFAQGQTLDRAQKLRMQLEKAVVNISRSPSNSLIPLSADEYGAETFVKDMLFRTSHRLGMILNCNELAAFIHLPSATVHSAKLRQNQRKTKAAPAITENHPFVLGLNEHPSGYKFATLPDEQRLRHMHVIGATGTGKSSFLLTSILVDMQIGNGVAVIDPHGDLIEQVLAVIPEHREEDVILIDPSDEEFPVGFNILSAHTEIEKEILSSDLVAVFRRLSTSWGDQMNSVFANAILAFLESNEGGTLADLRRFLIEKPFREKFLLTVDDPSIVYYWQKEFPILKSSSIGPILTRLDTFLRPKLIRNMVAQKKSPDFEEILNSQKILLVKLSQGLIGVENSYLLGTFIVAKIQQAAMARQAMSREERANFFLYVDEFQNFITPSMSAILSGARKYHLGLILAHQEMQQLARADSDLASSVISNAGTRVCFRLGDIDAKRLAEGFSAFEAQDLQNLPTGEAIVRLDRPEFDFTLSTILLPEQDKNEADERASRVRNYSRQKHGSSKQEIEALLAATYQFVSVPEIIQKSKEPPPQETQPKVSKERPIDTVEPKAQTHHRYLQTLIKKMAESRGYKATLEEPTPDGKGRVDVSLERNKMRIAVEIKDTTKDEWELQNIEKCLLAGYDVVVECATERKTIERLKKRVDQEFALEERNKISVMTPEDFFLFLDSEIAKEASSEKRMKGYRVKVQYNLVTEDNAGRIQETIAKSVINSMKPKKGKTSGDSI